MATRSGPPGCRDARPGWSTMWWLTCGGLPDVLAGRLTLIAARVSAAARAPERAFRGPVPACAYRQPACRRPTAVMPHILQYCNTAFSQFGRCRPSKERVRRSQQVSQWHRDARLARREQAAGRRRSPLRPTLATMRSGWRLRRRGEPGGHPSSVPRPPSLLIDRDGGAAAGIQALQELSYDVLATAVPWLEVYAQSFGMAIPDTGCDVWRQVVRDLIKRCAPAVPGAVMTARPQPSPSRS